jgi:hypothetical protein
LVKSILKAYWHLYIYIPITECLLSLVLLLESPCHAAPIFLPGDPVVG